MPSFFDKLGGIINQHPEILQKGTAALQGNGAAQAAANSQGVGNVAPAANHSGEITDPNMQAVTAAGGGPGLASSRAQAISGLMGAASGQVNIADVINNQGGLAQSATPGSAPAASPSAVGSESVAAPGAAAAATSVAEQGMESPVQSPETGGMESFYSSLIGQLSGQTPFDTASAGGDSIAAPMNDIRASINSPQMTAQKYLSAGQGQPGSDYLDSALRALGQSGGGNYSAMIGVTPSGDFGGSKAQQQYNKSLRDIAGLVGL